MKTTYIKDLEYDAFMIWVMLRGKDPSGVKKRAERMKIDKELLNSISGTKSYEEVKDLLEKVVKERYKKEEKTIDDAIVSYQRAWDEINGVFYGEVEKVTETKWEFSEYKVVVSPFHPGVANRGNNIVIRWLYEDPEDQKRITAHEILMIHIWSIIDNNYPEAKSEIGGGGRFWGLNEVTTTLILGLEPKLNDLWTPKKQGVDNFLQNYPQLTELKEELKEIYINKKSFSDYLTQAVYKI